MKKKGLLLTALFMALTVATTGCGVNRGTQMNYNLVNSIRKGVTTEQQVRALFGEPVATETRHKEGVKILQYKYSNNDHMKKDLAAIGGAALGGLLGHQIGGGSGRDIATGLGGLAGGALGENAVTTREEMQVLTVYIDLRTGVVRDYDFNESKGRTQSWQLNSGVGTL